MFLRRRALTSMGTLVSVGSNARFDKAVAKFALACADQNERDYQALLKAIRDGRMATFEE